MKNREQVLDLRESLSPETIEALNECAEMKEKPEKYKRYTSFKEVMDEIFKD